MIGFVKIVLQHFTKIRITYNAKVVVTLTKIVMPAGGTKRILDTNV
jgi:hypothetical protein